jgi:hypothetical protein
MITVFIKLKLFTDYEIVAIYYEIILQLPNLTNLLNPVDVNHVGTVNKMIISPEMDLKYRSKLNLFKSLIYNVLK